VRRPPEQSVLRRVVREHLETFLAEARAAAARGCRASSRASGASS